MSGDSSGNGDPRPKPGEVKIQATVIGPGWVVFEVVVSSPGNFPAGYWIHRSMIEWLRERPQVKVRASVPIMASGETVAIHLWFDE